MNKQLHVTHRTKVKRMKERASYDQQAVFAALDHALFGTIAFSDGHHVHAIPTAIWREHEYLYIHGSNGSRLLKCLQKSIEVCVSITNIHALVLARSAFHHSMNYDSVCIYGVFEKVPDKTKQEHLQRFMEHWMPDRWSHVRGPDVTELAATTIMRIPITEAVLKSRQGPPKDDIADMQQQVWAGVVPLKHQWQTPQQVAEQSDVHLPGQKLKLMS